jgi:hypothetical protein
MQSGDPLIVSDASECICSMAKTGNLGNLTLIAEIRAELIKAGLFTTLIAVVENNSQLISAPATLALSILLREDDAKLLLLKSSSKIIDTLVGNVISPFEDLCRNSIIALGNASKNASVCKAISQPNLINNLLQAINNPIMNLSHIAKDTLFKVIEQSNYFIVIFHRF